MASKIPDHSPLLRYFPELRRVDDPAERMGLWKKAVRERGWLVYLVICGLLGLGMLVLIVSARSLAARFWPNTLAGPIVSGIVGGFMGPAGAWAGIVLFRRQIHRSLRRQLVERGVAICVGCGYDLRGQVEPRCPECGEPFDLAILSGVSPPP